MNYIPKGSMCSNCKHSKSNCSQLDLKSMQVSHRKDNYTVVICSEFKREQK